MQSPQDTSRESPPAASPNARRWVYSLGVLAIVGLTSCVYWPALWGGFILDDDGLLTQNRLIHSGDGLLRIWLTTQAPEYYPISYSTLWIEWRLWGINPTGYHVTNLVLHIVSALLLWVILRRLSIGGAFLAALVFAIHPINCESVAWIAQRRSVMAMVFFLSSIYCYLRYEDDDARLQSLQNKSDALGQWYWLSLVMFLLAMLSKGSVAVLPVVLLALAWWKRGRITTGDWGRTARFFLIAIILTGINIWFQKHGTDVVYRQASAAQRLAGAGAVVWFYLAKALLPIRLLFVYPQWNIQTGLWRWWAPLAAIVIATAILWQRCRTVTGRPLWLAWLLFCVALVPVMGFTDVGFMQYSLVADHYQYIAMISLIVLIAAAVNAWHRGAASAMKWIPTTVAALGVAVLALLTWNQNQLYGGPIRLYSATVKENPECWMAQFNLGNALSAERQFESAIAHYQQANRYKPEDADILTNYGIALGASGQKQLGMEYLRRALVLRPQSATAHNNLGDALATNGHFEEAVEQFQEAIKLRPEFAKTWMDLAAAEFALGKKDQAVDAAQNALDLARTQGLTKLSDLIEARLAHYLGETKKPESELPGGGVNPQ